FPEYALTSSRAIYTNRQIRERLDRIRQRCHDARVTAIVGTTMKEEEQGKHRLNMVKIFSDRGDILGEYRKIVLTTRDQVEKLFISGDRLPVFTHHGLRFGVLICNDLWVTPGCGPAPDPRLS